jgi:hypothetical protein
MLVTYYAVTWFVGNHPEFNIDGGLLTYGIIFDAI